jgi:predicted nucleic acid-binding protein
MNVFLDTNVLIDVLAEREPFYSESAQIWTLAEKGRIDAYISAISFNNIFYVVRRLRTPKVAYRMMVLLRSSFTSVTLDQQILNQAIDAGLKDFEDAIQYFSALHASVDCIVSRNVQDFPKSDLSILTPHEFLTAFAK